MTGLPPEVGTAFLNIVGEIVVREGGRFTAGETTTELAEGPPMPVIDVQDRSSLTAVATLYGDVPAIQIVWPDSRGQFPWDSAYANRQGSQTSSWLVDLTAFASAYSARPCRFSGNHPTTAQYRHLPLPLPLDLSARRAG